MPPTTGRIYDRNRLEGPSATNHSRDNREESIYGLLADMIGFQGAQVLAGPLCCIMWFCLREELPALTVLVVNKVTGTPSEGLQGVENFDTEREKVFSHPWYEVMPPTVEQLTEAQVHAKAAGWDLKALAD